MSVPAGAQFASFQNGEPVLVSADDFAAQVRQGASSAAQRLIGQSLSDPKSPFGGSTIAAISDVVTSGESTSAAVLSNVAALNTQLNAEIARAQTQEGTLHTLVTTAQSTADGAVSSISTETTQRGTADGALSARIDTVAASASSAAAANTSEAAARASADSALAATQTTLSAQLAGTQGSGLKASIDGNATTAATATSAVASQVSSLNVTVASIQASVSTQAGAIADTQGKVATYWQVIETLPSGTARIALVNSGGASTFLVDSNMLLNGSLIVGGTIIASKFLTDQGVDLAAVVPGTFNFKLSGAWSGASAVSTGSTLLQASTGTCTISGHTITATITGTLHANSAYNGSGDASVTSLELYLAYQVGGSWSYTSIDLGNINAGSISATQSVTKTFDTTWTGQTVFAVYAVASGDPGTVYALNLAITSTFNK